MRKKLTGYRWCWLGLIMDNGGIRQCSVER